MQSNVITIPRTANRAHMQSNADIFDFELSEEDMRAINALNKEQDNNWDTLNFNF